MLEDAVPALIDGGCGEPIFVSQLLYSQHSQLQKLLEELNDVLQAEFPN